MAPLYDLSSQLPYPELIEQKLAMKIGEHYQIARVGREDWQRVALACAIAEDTLIGMIVEMAESLPDAISSAHAQAISDGLAASVVTPLLRQRTQHARERLFSITTIRSTKRPRIRNRDRR